MTRTRPSSRPAACARRLAVTLALLGLAACGGGDDNGGGGNDAPDVTLTASPTTISLGQSTTLTWTASAGTSCTASGGWSGTKTASGTESVTPTAAGPGNYSLSCTGGTYGGTGSASAAVTVNAATAFVKTVLVADTAGVGAQTVDPNLVNPWGVVFGTTTSVWVANARSDTSTVYDGNGKPQPAAAPIVANLPNPATGVDFEPTGIVFNGSTDFVVSVAGRSGPARFIFAGEGGAIAGWSSTADPANAVIVHTDAGGASYTGLALANDGTANFLYAADFANNKIDVFDASFAKQPTTTRFGFVDDTLAAGYAPFGIQALPTGTGGAMQIYVAYARNDAGQEAVGAGLGLVNVFDTSGVLVKRLVVTGGRLNAPWGMALAPADAGTFANAVLVGNFGDGRINGFDAATGSYVGTISDAGGQPFAVPGLWGIAFGNDRNNQPHTTLFYAAGTNGEANGEYGRMDMGSTPPVLNEPPTVTLTAPAAGNVSGTVTLTANATSSINVARVEFFAGTTSLGNVTTAPYSIAWNTTASADGPVALTARATDANGNVGTSAAVNVTVANTAPPAATLTQVQAQIFTPKCSGCHDGSNPAGGPLPGSQDLRNGQSFASLVNVASLERPTLMRVVPGNAANSYLVHKVEGSPDIQGSRMPPGGTSLTAAEIALIRAWIDAGALNN